MLIMFTYQTTRCGFHTSSRMSRIDDPIYMRPVKQHKASGLSRLDRNDLYKSNSSYDRATPPPLPLRRETLLCPNKRTLARKPPTARTVIVPTPKKQKKITLRSSSVPPDLELTWSQHWVATVGDKCFATAVASSLPSR